ncbi:MAG: hypothetical protein AAFN77_06445 [Planctomycetota bacterium]
MNRVTQIQSIALIRALSMILLIGLPLSVQLGCSQWKRNPDKVDGLMLPANRLTADTVRLEVGVAQLDETQQSDMQSLWRLLDQQELPLEIRQLLDRHGLRVAVMSSRPPSIFADLIYPPEIKHEDLSEFQQQLHIKGHLQPETRMVGHANVANRLGQKYKVMTSDTHSSLSWTIEGDAQSTAGAGDAVRGVFAISTYPQGDGSVRLVVEPQIHHGDQQQRYGSTENGFKWESKQKVQTVDRLKFELDLQAGETLVIGPTADIAQLGHLFFGPTDSADTTLTNPEKMELETLETTLDQLAIQAEALIDEVPESELSIDEAAEPVSPYENELKLADDALLTDQELLEAEVREMLTVKDGEEAVLPSFKFAEGAPKPRPLHRLLLVRVVQTQLDDLFTEVNQTEPLTNVDRY